MTNTKPVCNIDIGDLLDWIAIERDVGPETAQACLSHLESWVASQQPTIADARCGNCGCELFNPAVGDRDEH